MTSFYAHLIAEQDAKSPLRALVLALALALGACGYGWLRAYFDLLDTRAELEELGIQRIAAVEAQRACEHDVAARGGVITALTYRLGLNGTALAALLDP